MAALIYWSWVTIFLCAVTLVAAKYHHQDHHQDRHRDSWPDPWTDDGWQDPRRTDDTYNGDDNDDDDGDVDNNDSVSHALIIGGFVCGAILLATAAIIVALCCLKKAKRPKRIVGQEPPCAGVAFVGSRLPRSRGNLPYSSTSVNGSSKVPIGTVGSSHSVLPYNLPARGPPSVEDGGLLQLNAVMPESGYPPLSRCSPPPPYSKVEESVW